jgi:secretion/DNA translocation related TadE-like protein
VKPDRQSRAERGSVTVITVSVLSFATILVLVLVDLLRALESRSSAQTAADAAALAAAQEIARPSRADPSALAAEYAWRNAARLIECRCDGGTAAAVVTVEVAVDGLFVGADRTVRATAKAVIEPSGAG